MEINLTKNAHNQCLVTCDGQFSHAFSSAELFPEQQAEKNLLSNPVETGKRLFDVLFRAGTPARTAWEAHPKRILLVCSEVELDAIPWEYLHSPNAFIVLDVAFVRGLPASQRQPAPDLHGVPLHIIAVPSNPIAHEIARLDIEGEWLRLKASLNGLESAITLERVRPPTLEQARRLVANKHLRVIHFMGHGGQADRQALLLFENEYGAPKGITVQDFIRRMEDSAFLVTLNACISATPGKTEFSNFARALAEHGVPYALGMRFSIPDDDAKAFSRTFYDELARGSLVENALRHARASLAESRNPWAVGTPVLYTSLEAAAPGFETPTGSPRVLEHQPPLELYVLPPTAGAFQGRVDELLSLGKALTGEPRPKLLTIHGAGGQGKTALAREAAERFAHAWPGGVWAATLETRPTRAAFAFQLAQFLRIPTDSFPHQEDLERAILTQLNQHRTLLVLDNAETFTEAVKARDSQALDLAAFLRDGLLSTPACLLVTSREPLGWPGEQVLLLEGLSPAEGAALFFQSAPQRQGEIHMAQVEALSQRLEGHPLALLLLGLAFNETSISLEQFIAEHEARLLKAENRYHKEDHRHRTLYASMETSVRYLDEPHKALLSALWIFQAPFMPGTVARIFTPPDLAEDQAGALSESIAEQLHTLARRGLLVSERETLGEGSLLLYRTLPTLRLFARHYLGQALPVETLQERLASAYEYLVNNIYRELDRTTWASYLARRCRADFEACFEWLLDEARGGYANRLGWVLQRTGDTQAGLRWLEQALALAQGKDQDLELQVRNNMALVYSATGHPDQALALYQQALPMLREVGDRAGEATTLNNMAEVYRATGHPDQALALYQQALPIRREVGDRAGEAATLNNMAGVYSDTGHPDQALALYQQALPIWRAVGDRAGEAVTCFNMAWLLRDLGQAEQAVALLRQAVRLEGQVHHPDYPQDSALLAQWEAALAQGKTLPQDSSGTGASGLSAELVQTIAANTLKVLTDVPEKLSEWRDAINGALGQARANSMPDEMEFFGAILALLERQEPAIPVGNPYAQVVNTLVQRLTGSPDEQGAPVSRELSQAVQAYLQAPDLAATRQAVEQHQALLFAPEAHQVLAALSERAHNENNAQAADFFAMHLALLQACLENGIAATFDRLAAQPDETPPLPGGLPADFVIRCTAGLKAAPQERQALFTYLTQANARVSTPEAGKLISCAIQVIFGADPATLGADLPEPYASIWQAIVSRSG
jgi:tetratricopeptide (TPR) repeat protein